MTSCEMSEIAVIWQIVSVSISTSTVKLISHINGVIL